MNNYIRQHNFIEKLQLKKNDPQGFLKRFATSQRMEKRAATLFRQILKTNKKGKLADKRTYCAAYAQLSQNYLDRAHQLQPYLASGFEEVAQIIPARDEKAKLAEVAKFYDVFNRLKDASTPQSIYINFLDLAQQAYDNNQFVVTLQLLKNAAQIESWFEDIVVSANYSSLYNQSLDGVMTSYLRVSIIANKAGQFEMADKYYKKALLVFDEFGSAYLDDGTVNASFLHFTGQQIELAQHLLANSENVKAFTLLKQARNIRKCKDVYQDCPQIDSQISQSLRGMFNQKLDTVDALILQKEYDSALVSMNAAKSFVESYSAYFTPFPTNDFLQAASILFDTNYNWGEDLLVSKQPEKALTVFLKAQTIEREYLPSQNTRLKILIYNATVPVILNKIAVAEFETWANRMDNAESIYQEAKQLQHDYEQEKNEELNAAFLVLENKMRQRKCVDMNYRVHNLNTLIVNRVQSRKFDLAARFLQEADSIIRTYPDCNIDGAETRKLEKKYAALFDFLTQSKKVEQYNSDRKYDSVVKQYIVLQHIYIKNKLQQFGVDEPLLFAYVDSIGNSDLCREAALYFVQKKDFMEAFRFLGLLKKQHLPARESKELQQLIGNGIGILEREQAVENLLPESVQSDKWFRVFQQARLAAVDLEWAAY